MGLNQLAGVYFAVFPNLETTVEAVMNDGDLTVIRWSGVGTHEGRQMAVPPTRRMPMRSLAFATGASDIPIGHATVVAPTGRCR